VQNGQRHWTGHSRTPQPALATLAQSTVFLLAWRALLAYCTFLVDIRQRAGDATDAPAALYVRFTSENRARLLAGVYYLVRALREVTHSLSGDRASGIGGGALLEQRAEELISGTLNACMPHMPGATVTHVFRALEALVLVEL
jgi:hypothetical protein